MIFLVLFSLFSAIFAQELVNLNTLPGGGQHFPLPGTGPYAIYVSAYSDSNTVLDKIYVITGDGQTSLLTLKNKKLLQNSGELQPFVVKDTAYVTTTLNTNDLKALHGVMFISSTNQLNNQNFHVVDVSMAQTLPVQTVGEQIYLFLNTHMGTNPYQSSIISQWNQNKNTVAFMYQGIPTDNAQGKHYQIFSNPVQSTNDLNQFFSTVEKFSLTLPAFYLMSVNGAPGFRIEPGYYSIDRTTTSQTSSTGFYMKAKGQDDKLVQINMKRDTKYTGSTGFNMLGSLPSLKQVTFGVYDGASKWEESSVANPFFSPRIIPHIGQNVQISSNGGVDGQYFVQYFILQGGLNTGTTVLPGRQTTAYPGGPTVPGGRTVPHVETTTQASGSTQIFVSLLVLLGFVGFL